MIGTMTSPAIGSGHEGTGFVNMRWVKLFDLVAVFIRLAVLHKATATRA